MIVVDTSAIVAIIAQEPEAPAFRSAIKQNLQLAMSAFTVLECRTVLHRRFARPAQAEFDQFLRVGNVMVEPFDDDLAGIAFSAYRTYGKGSGHKAQLNLGDCASYALATSLDLPLLFKGNDFTHTDVRPALAPS